MSRPMLLPHLRPLWRDRTTLQLGTDPARAVVLEFADPAAAHLLDLLDGVRTEAGVMNAAAARGVPAALARDVITALRTAGVVVEAHTLFPRGLTEETRRRLYPEAAALSLRLGPTGRTPASVLRRRRVAHVLVGGAAAVPATAVPEEPSTDPPEPPGEADADADGADPSGPAVPLAGTIVEILTAAGIGRVTRTGVDPLPHGGHTFVVRVGAERRPAALVARAYAQRGVAHITVVVRDGAVVVGPLVPPAGSPCLRCVDLHRVDRDPAWPALAAQLATAEQAPLTCAATTRVAAAAYVADEVLAYIDGMPARTRGASVEVSGPDRFRRRTWPPHPRCDCRGGRRSGAHAQESS